MITMPLSVFIVGLITAAVVGALFYDAVDTIIDDAISTRLNARPGTSRSASSPGEG